LANAGLPAGWRQPLPAEISTPADPWRDRDSEAFLRAEGDFDGDGRSDRAELLVSSDGRHFALFVLLGTGRQLRLLREKISVLPAFGVAKVVPSTFPTACGKGYWECKKGEPSHLSLSRDAIMFFKRESAASVFVWSASRKAFRRIWVSD
jgi:hypothetical protein